MSESAEPKPETPKEAADSAKPTGSAAETPPTEASDGPAQEPVTATPGAIELEELTEEAAAAAEADPRDDRISALETEVASVKDQLMRAVADVQNARKRADRERKEGEAYGGLRLARDLLAVHDNLEMALQAASDELQEREAEFFNGVALTLRTLVSSFEKHNIRMIRPDRGDKFDPNVHQAMFEAETADVPAGTISEVMQPGFTIAERLLRPALVGVAKAPSAAPNGGAADGESGAAAS